MSGAVCLETVEEPYVFYIVEGCEESKGVLREERGCKEIQGFLRERSGCMGEEEGRER